MARYDRAHRLGPSATRWQRLYHWLVFTRIYKFVMHTTGYTYRQDSWDYPVAFTPHNDPGYWLRKVKRFFIVRPLCALSGHPCRRDGNRECFCRSYYWATPDAKRSIEKDVACELNKRLVEIGREYRW